MKKEEVHLWDWERILVGNAPFEFLLESFIRTIIIYLILLIGMRLLGKRMNSNISITELAVMITLGAIISVPMQVPERGLIPGILILACVIIYQRTLNWLSYKYKKVEVITQGDVSALVKNGVIDVAELKRSALSHEQLFAQLRGEKIRHLGQVKRVYLEACGNFSIFRHPHPKPGLAVVPAGDTDLFKSEVKSDQFWACKNCGYVIESHVKKSISCSNCGANDWDQAVNEQEEEFEAAEKRT